MLYTISFALFSQTIDSQEIRSPLIDANDVCSSGSDNIGSIPIEIDSDYQYSCASCCSNGLIENIRDQSEVSKWNFNNCGSSTSNPNETECFAMIETIDLDLKCSPNNYLWFKDNYVIQDYPLCSSWCSSWYASCKHVRVCTDSPYPQGGSCPSGNDTCPTFQDIIKIDDSWDDVVTARRFCEEFFDLYAVSVINEGGLLPDPCINPNNPASVIAIINTKNMELASRNETIPLFHCESTGLDWWEIILVILGLLLVIGSIGGCIYYFCVVRKKNKNDTYDINSIEVNNKDVLNTNAAADISYVQPVDNTLYVQPGDDSLYVQPVDDTYQRVTLERANNATLVRSSGNQTSQYGDPNQALQMSYMQNSMAQSQSQRNPAYLDSDYV